MGNNCARRNFVEGSNKTGDETTLPKEKPLLSNLPNNLMRSRDDDICKFYELDALLEEGSISMIRAAKKKSSGQMYALKTIPLSRISPDCLAELRNEINLLRSLDHPNIIKAVEAFDTRRRIHLVLELCTGGDLYSRHPYTEEQACNITLQIASAITYLHDRGVVHRDLKFENVLFCSKSTHSIVKVIDFGLSSKYTPGHALHGSVGTLYCMAPEVIGGTSNEASDCWSLGVLVFMLLSSQMPFFGQNEDEVVEKITTSNFGFRTSKWENISEEAKDLVRKLLVVDLKKRITAAQALEHAWLHDFRKEQDMQELPSIRENSGSGAAPLDEVFQSMKRFATYGKLKKAALMIIAHQCNAEQVSALRDAFNRFDHAKNGQIALWELKLALKDCENPLTEKQVDKLFADLDVDETGLIHYTEFLASTVEAMGNIETEKLEEAFDRLDTDNSGFITIENLKEILGDDYEEATLRQMIAEGDFNKNGHIDFEEFRLLMQGGVHKETARLNDLKMHL